MCRPGRAGWVNIAMVVIAIGGREEAQIEGGAMGNWRRLCARKGRRGRWPYID